MKNDEKTPSTIGIFRLSNYKSDASDKVMRIFTKLKRKAERVESKAELVQPEPNLEELRQSAVKSLHILPEVVKTEHGFEIV
jgi:hypothetical protein